MQAAYLLTALIGLAPVLAGSIPAQAQIRLDSVNTVPCAEEGGVCRMPYPTNVYFGVPGKVHGRPFPQGGSIPCNVQSFGDPAPNQRKACWYAPRISDNGGGRYRDDVRSRRDDDRDDDRVRRDDRYRDEYRPRRDPDRDYDEAPRGNYEYGPVRRRPRVDPEDE